MKKERLLSVFVDESGNFGDVHDLARYCIVTLVFHDQEKDISRAIQDLDRANDDLGLDTKTFKFHTMPLIRQDDEYAAMSRRLRGRILDRMLTFVRNVEFKYCSFLLDTAFVNTPEQIVTKLGQQIRDYMLSHKNGFRDFGSVKVYYDAGQKPVGRLLQETLGQLFACPIEFAQGVRQSRYKMLQVADLICAAELINLRLEDGQPMPLAESRFFGGPRDFKRNLLKKIRAKRFV